MNKKLLETSSLILVEKTIVYKLLYQQQGIAVPRGGDRSYVTGSIRGLSKSHLTCMPGGC